MNNADNGAFPVFCESSAYCDPGLTKREYFAAMAMQGLMANSAYEIVSAEKQLISKWSVEYADSLLKALEK